MIPGGVLTCYGDFARALSADGVLSDPWIEGAPRFRMTPVVMEGAAEAALRRAAEAVVAAHGEAAALCRARPELVDRFLHLPPAHRWMWDAGGPAWHGLARADVFVTAEGPKVCELNSDTPTGQPEAVALGRLYDGGVLAAPAHDPNRDLGARVCDLVEAAAARMAPGPARDRPGDRAIDRPGVGLLYPTEITDELCVVELFTRWFEGRGFRVVLGSPYNLRSDGAGGVALFGVPCPIVWRLYKTDWWGERRRIWRSARPFPDPAALTGPLALLLGAVERRRCAVLNPFGAVLTQNKRVMALMWEAISLFSPRARAAIRRYIPFTARLEALPPAEIAAERERWVLKSDYGCEGEEVLVGAELSAREWGAALADAVPGRWVAQRRFRALPLDDGLVPNHGVYVVAGRAAGLYTRLQRGATDRHALSAASLVRWP